MEKIILWVDDEIDLLKAHIIFLEERGYKVETAANGDDAIEQVNNNHFDLVLLDEMMPGRDGLSTLIELKDIKPNLPVVMVTKSEEERLMEQAIGQKIDDYLTKPVNPSQVLSVVKRILDKKRIMESHLTQEVVTEFNRVSTQLMGPLGWQEWIDIHTRLSSIELELENFRDVGLHQSHQDLRRQCNAEFANFAFKNYTSWIKGEDSPPPLSVDIVKNYVAPHLKNKKMTVFIVIDCMRYDQWLIIEPVLAEYFNIRRECYYSILPTAHPGVRSQSQ